MSNHRISIDTSITGATVLDLLRAKANEPESVVKIGNLLQAIGGGQYPAKVRWNGNAVQANGTVTFSSIVEDDTVTINGVVFTGKDVPATSVQFETGVSDESSANSLRSKVNACTTNLIVGCVGATRRGTVQLASFVEDDTITVNGVVFTGKDSPAVGNYHQFKIGGTDSLTAEFLLQAITKAQDLALQGISVTRSTDTLTFNYNGSLTLAASANATVASAIVVVKCLIPGQIGNLCSLAISANGSVSGANLASGTEGTEVVFSRDYSAV